jgi:hypothetical protein
VERFIGIMELGTKAKDIALLFSSAGHACVEKIDQVDEVEVM